MPQPKAALPCLARACNGPQLQGRRTTKHLCSAAGTFTWQLAGTRDPPANSSWASSASISGSSGCTIVASGSRMLSIVCSAVCHCLCWHRSVPDIARRVPARHAAIQQHLSNQAGSAAIISSSVCQQQRQLYADRHSMTMLCCACQKSQVALRRLLTLGTCFCGGSSPSCSALAASARRFSRRWRFSFCRHHHAWAA